MTPLGVALGYEAATSFPALVAASWKMRTEYPTCVMCFIVIMHEMHWHNLADRACGVS